MASLSKDGSGWRILFVCPATGKRHTVRTGRCARKDAETARNMVEKLLQARRLGTAIDGQTAEWLKAIDDKLRDRLARVGLVDLPRATLLGPFLDDYIEQRRRRGDVTDSTIEVWGHTRRNLKTYFGPDKDMRTIGPADADDWAAWLRSHEKLAENTIRKRSQFAKKFFAVAVKRKLLPENPFAGLVGAVVSVPDRQYFVPRESVDLLLEQCHGPEFRLLLVMARYLGVRVPSEIVPMKWGHVDWEKMRIVITSPKTKRHKGGDKRVCPIFPEVAPALREAWEAAPEGAQWIFPSVRHAGKNLRSWLERAILRSGLTPWPRLWQNFPGRRNWPTSTLPTWRRPGWGIANGLQTDTTDKRPARITNGPSKSRPAPCPGTRKNRHRNRHSTRTNWIVRGRHPIQEPRKKPRLTRAPQETASCGAIRDSANTPSGGHGTRTRNPGQGAPHFQ